LEKSSNIRLHNIRSLRAELFHQDGQTYRHDEANIRFSQFFERISERKRLQ